MKILHVIDYFQPKLGYQETFLAREHIKSGHEVYVITSDRYRKYLHQANLFAKRIKGSGFFVEEGIKVWRLKTLFETPYNLWMSGLEKKIQELNPDLIIMHGIINISAVRIAKLKNNHNFKLIYDCHMTFENTNPKTKILYYLFKPTFAKLIKNKADGFIAILPDTKKFMNARYGIPLEKISLIPLGADKNIFKFDKKIRKEIRTKLKINEAEVVFIYTGKLISFKKLDLLIESAKLLETHNLKILFVGSGDEEYIKELKKDIENKNLKNKFIWHSSVPNNQLAKFYSAADVGVWPYGASVGMREALSCGLPILINKNSKIEELIYYKNGFLFKDNDASDLALKMKKLLDNNLRKKMGGDSRKLVEDKFDWVKIAKQFLDLSKNK